MKIFSEIVEEVKTLNLGEKVELNLLLDRIISEERRSEMLENFKESKKEEHTYRFSNNINELKNRLR